MWSFESPERHVCRDCYNKKYGIIDFLIGGVVDKVQEPEKKT